MLMNSGVNFVFQPLASHNRRGSKRSTGIKEQYRHVATITRAITRARVGGGEEEEEEEEEAN